MQEIKEVSKSFLNSLIAGMSYEEFEKLREEEEKEQIKKLEQERKYLRLKKFLSMSIIDRNSGKDIFKNAKYTNKDEEALYETARQFCNSFNVFLDKGKGFLFSGDCGTGKTFLANCICNELKAKGYGILSFSMSDYFNKIRVNAEEEERLKEAIKDADLIFIDDLGSEQINRKNGSLWAEEKLFNLFDTRYRVKKPMIITTNLSKDELKEHLKVNGTDKIFSRLNEMIYKAYKFDFEDKRTNKDFNF